MRNMESFIARHIAEVPPSGIRKFFDIASEMKDAISLGVGEPDFVTPWNIRETAIFSIEHGSTHYTSNWGTIELRREIAKYLSSRYGLGYNPKNEIAVTVGASEALDLVFRAIINPGDEILVPAPSYVSYMPGVRFAGGVPVCMETKEKDEFKLTEEIVRRSITSKTKAIVIPYPNNPTGAIMTKEELSALREVIIKHDLLVISDEIYSELTYGSGHASIASFADIFPRCVVINGFSKAFAMTGFRLGYAAGPEPIISAMVKIHQYSMLAASTMSQAAGVEAIRHEMDTGFAQVEKMRKSYDQRRQYIFRSFNDIGLPCFEPKGAFYVFPNITKSKMSSEDFCNRLIHEKKVACVPGTAFGEAGEGFMRCSYAASIENIKEALRRIAEFVNENS
ncbi:MAG: aminotransferase class I/II-fold pyridoxal phosphate-dependent enzyme [Eubacteriales bacterium]